MNPARRVRNVKIWQPNVTSERHPDGTIYLCSGGQLGGYPDKITARLEYWAKHAPDRIFLARRNPSGAWNKLTYAEALSRVRSISEALLQRKLSAERPVLILSGNSIEHALLALSAMYCGILYAPIAPAYSLATKEYDTLRFLWNRLRPGLVFAAEGQKYERALRSVCGGGTEIVVTDSTPESLPATPFEELRVTGATGRVDDAHKRVGPDTIAKILFTSGSTGQPKGVINTQRMLCSNQEMIRGVMGFLAEEPPVLCDWLPWNHTFGGNHNFGMALYNGGTLYIDDGKPSPAHFEITVRNLREIATTAYLNVPRGFEMLVTRMRTDSELRQCFYSKLNLLFYAAAGLRQHVWDELQELAVETCGEGIVMMTGLGATESSPAALFTGAQDAASGAVGLPAPGVKLKLLPVGNTLEIRLRGPNITPGFWREDTKTRESFDEEGFYKLGDAVRFLDPENHQKGLAFDGRLDEDFKLSSGTWVRVGPLRARFLTHFGSWLQDVVFASPQAEFLCALIFPNVDACRNVCPELDKNAPFCQVLKHERVRSQFQTLLDQFAVQSTGSSTCIVRMILLDYPPSMDSREITAKGSINQKMVLENRSEIVRELYDEQASARTIEITRVTGATR